MATTPAAARFDFQADLESALALASQANSTRHRNSQASTFGHWIEFCHDQSVSITLREFLGDPELGLGYLLVCGIRYRRYGRKDHPVTAGAVSKALAAVGKGIQNLGQPDPRYDIRTGKLHSLHAAFTKKLEDDDDPPSRAYPVNISILRSLPNVLDTEHDVYGRINAHVIDLIIVAFFWLLRPGEYSHTPDKDSKTQPFELQHIYFDIDGHIYNAADAPLNDDTFPGLRSATLEFVRQKNAVKGERVGHSANSDPFFCPAKALARIARRLRQDRAPANRAFHTILNTPTGRLMPAKSTCVTNALQHAASLHETRTGILSSKIAARSLRPGGATALLCANVGTEAIMLLGRWKSDAMFRYLRVQAATTTFSQRMLDAGDFTFTPSAFEGAGLPREAPAAVIAIADSDDLTDGPSEDLWD